MHLPVRIRLSVMMFLQFAIWGSWFVTTATYLQAVGFDGLQIGAAYSTMNWGAIFAPIVAGAFADRFFQAQKVMGVLHLVGAVLLWWISSITDPGAFFWALLAYAICYMPTLGLANAISFHQMRDPAQEFPGIRVMGTIGWIAVGIAVGTAAPHIFGHSIEPTNLPLKLGAALSVLLGIYAFFLPATPPANAGTRPTLAQALGLETLACMKDRSFAIFTIGSALICIPLSFYYSFANVFLNETGMTGTAGKMALGQVSELLFLLLIPLLFARWGVNAADRHGGVDAPIRDVRLRQQWHAGGAAVRRHHPARHLL
jgi:nucleoside transporter